MTDSRRDPGPFTRTTRRSSSFARYVFAVAAVALASLLRFVLTPVLGDGATFILYSPAVVLAAWFGGLWPALLSAGLSGLIAWYVFLPPHYSFAVSDLTAPARLLLFLVASVLISVLAENLHRARRTAEAGETREREQGERFRVTLASIGDAVIATDAQCRVTLMNEVAQSLTGWTEQEALGRPLEEVFNIVNDQTRERVGNPAVRAIREGRIVGLANHTVLITKHGTDVPIDDSGAPIKGADGRAIGAILVFRDITERRRAEDRFRLAVESAPNAMVMVDQKGYIVLVNSETERLFGYTRGELSGRPVEMLVPQRFRGGHPQYRAGFHRAPAMRAMGAGRELYGARKDGSEVPIEIGLNPLVIGGETLVLSSIVDITERKQAERRQELQHAATRVLAETPDVQDAVPEVLRLIGEELGWDIAAAWTVDRDANVLRCAGIWRHPEVKVASFEASTRERTFLPGAGLPGRVWATGEPVWLANAAEDGEFLRASEAAADGIHGAVFVPIQVGSDVAGVIEVLSHRLQPRDPDTLVTLSSVANRIGRFLERQRADEERPQLLGREQKARQEAERANRTKDDFLAMLSHELRTPLTTILGWARMLRAGQTPPDQVEQALASIERNAQLQTRLIEDLLDVSRIVSGKLTFESQRVDLAAVVDAAVEAVRGPAAATGIALVVDIDQALPPMVGDPVRLQQVVWNLLSNAIKFTDHGGRVDVRVRQVNGTLELVVQDNGRGIRRELLPHVFDRFRQGEAGGSRATGGLGLGLTIVRYLVERHGGTVQAASAGEGKGAAFTVRLPLAQRTGVAAEPSTAAGAEARSPSARGTLAGVTILVVEDDADTVRLLETVLGSVGARVVSTRSAKDARDLLETHPVDVMISDLSMAGEDGFALIRHVRATEAVAQRLLAIALTAHAREEDRARALAGGFDLYVRKPVDPADLLRMIAGFARPDRRAQ